MFLTCGSVSCLLADIFNRLRYMDRRGSGFKKIVEDYQMYANVSNGAKPVFKSELSSFFITLPNLQYVVKEQADILSIMAENPTVTAAELASMLGLTSRHIQRLIKDLVEKEIIRREGGRKLGKWIIL